MFINHYEILGVPRNAETVQIAAAYKRLMRKFHPDLNQSDEDAHDQALLINEAFKVLSDPELRKSFDRKLDQEINRKATTGSSFDRSESHGDGESESQKRDAHAADSESENKTFGQSQSASQGPRNGSFHAAAAPSGRTSRNSPSSGLWVTTGIVLGALTAIPIGLFLVWTISGFDPMGIFRERKVAQSRTSDEKNAEHPSKQLVNEKGIRERSDSANKADLKDGSNPGSRIRTSQEPKKPIEESNSNSSTTGGTEKKDAVADSEAKNRIATKATNQSPDGNTESNAPETDKTIKTDSTNSSSNKAIANDSRMEIPDSELIAKAKDQITQLFQARYEEAKSKLKVEKFKGLMEVSNEISKLIKEEPDGAKAFALYQVAIEIGRESCFANETLRLVADFESRYKIDGLQYRVDLFQYWKQELAKTIRDPKEKKAASSRLAAAGKPSLDRAAREKDWKKSVQLARILQQLYQVADEESNESRMRHLADKFEFLSSQYDQVKLHLQKLKEDPDLDGSNYCVGAYFSFLLGEWDKGLPYLAKCNDPLLAECAQAELKQTQDHSSIGDLWWKLQEDVNFKEFRTAIAAHAASHYKLALFDTTGIQNKLLRSRIVEMSLLKINQSVFPNQIENGSDPEIEIIRAEFGQGRNAGRCEPQLRRFVKDKDRIVTVSTPGLGMKNLIPGNPGIPEQ